MILDRDGGPAASDLDRELLAADARVDGAVRRTLALTRIIYPDAYAVILSEWSTAKSREGCTTAWRASVGDAEYEPPLFSTEGDTIAEALYLLRETIKQALRRKLAEHQQAANALNEKVREICGETLE